MTEHPLAEMCLGLQTDQRALSTSRALDFASVVRTKLPQIELHDRIDKLGAGAEIKLTPAGPTNPRWWFSNAGGDRLLQVQDNIVVLNWRRRDSSQAYPGYAAMKADFEDYFQLWKSVAGTETPVPVTYHVLYDNMWTISSETKVADIFKFWNTLGFRGRQQGPALNWSVALSNLDHERPAPMSSRIDVEASVGFVQKEDVPMRAARLQFSGFIFASDRIQSDKTPFDLMHDKMHELLKLLIADGKIGDFN